MKDRIKKLSEKYLERVMELRRELHQYPELGFDLFKTAEIVKKELDRVGIPYKSEIAKTGIVATIKGGKPGKTVLLRTLIRAMAKVGVVDICDPKQADFVTMSEQKAFEGRISYEVEDIVSMIERAVQIMFARYAYMRKMREENGDKDLKKFFEYGLEPYFLVCDEYNALCAMLDFQTRQRLDNAMGQFLLLGRQAGCFAVIAMQKPSREDLGSKLQANINFRISVGRLDEVGYDLAFGEVNRNKEFKYVKYLGGKRVYGRGYASVYGEVAREFYSPLLEKGFSFTDEYDKIERRENLFNPLENPKAELSEEEKENLQAEMEAQEELQKGEVKKASPELVQELMSSKQQEEVVVFRHDVHVSLHV